MPTLELRANQPTKISGYALRFDTDTDMGAHKERVLPSALRDLDEHDVIATVDHTDREIIARRSSGNLNLSVDARGLHYSIEFDSSNPRHVQLAADIRAGHFAGSSYEFRVPRGGDEMRNGTRIINRMSIRQVGPVIFPANPETSVEARSHKAADEWAERYKRTQYLKERM